jgi:Helix-turn-helix domain
LWADDGLRELAIAARQNAGGGIDIRSVATVIAIGGQNGRGCFATAKTVADLIGCHRNTVEAARKELIQRGWFIVTSRRGGINKRSLVVDIALPWGVVLDDGPKRQDEPATIPVPSISAPVNMGEDDAIARWRKSTGRD